MLVDVGVELPVLKDLKDCKSFVGIDVDSYAENKKISTNKRTARLLQCGNAV